MHYYWPPITSKPWYHISNYNASSDIKGRLKWKASHSTELPRTVLFIHLMCHRIFHRYLHLQRNAKHRERSQSTADGRHWWKRHFCPRGMAMTFWTQCFRVVDKRQCKLPVYLASNKYNSIVFDLFLLLAFCVALCALLSFTFFFWICVCTSSGWARFILYWMSLQACVHNHKLVLFDLVRSLQRLNDTFEFFILF